MSFHNIINAMLNSGFFSLGRGAVMCNDNKPNLMLKRRIKNKIFDFGDSFFSENHNPKSLKYYYLYDTVSPVLCGYNMNCKAKYPELGGFNI